MTNLHIFIKILGYIFLAITIFFSIHIFNLNLSGNYAMAVSFRILTLILTVISFILIVIGMILDPHHRY